VTDQGILEIYGNDSFYPEVSKTITVRAGNKKALARVQFKKQQNKNKNTACINAKLASRLNIPLWCYNYAIQETNIRLGPFIGVLTTRKKNSSPFFTGKKGRLYKELIVNGREKGCVIFYFFPEGLNQKRQVIKGYTLIKGKWQERIFPYPDIIYNRIRFRKIENTDSVRHILNYFESNPSTYLFNTRFLDKWEVYQAITQYQVGKKFIPATDLYNADSLNKFIAAYSEVFVKPRNGSLGIGIVKIAANKNGSVKFGLAKNSNGDWFNCSSIDALYERLKLLGIKPNRYLVQKAVNLATYKSRVFDLRTQVQKNGQGKWVLTGAAIRVAGKNRFVTHIPNGGFAASYEKVIENVFTDLQLKNRLQTQLEEIYTSIPIILEKELGINLGVLSMDIGIDVNGDMWILEVNSKPSSFDEKDIRFRHWNYLLDYCDYIYSKKLED